MRYLYYDLGEQEQETWVVAHLSGSWANVILLDSLSFERYRRGLPFMYTGGLCAQTPARVQVPRDGHWYLVVDCGGFTHRLCVTKIEVLTADSALSAAETGSPHVGANAS